MNNQKIIVKTVEEREKLFITLYKDLFPAVARYVSKMGGTFDEAKDVFQDALVIWYEKAVEGTVNHEKGYLIGIAKHLWLKRFRDNSKLLPMDGLDLEMEEEIEPSESKILSFLQTAGKKCMDLLRSFYYEELPLADIAETFGFSGARSATVQKYKCLEKVREIVKEKALTYEDFVD
ncbi:MAG TPA: sigma factor [Mucilaginibacter sp.]|jgi:DNA-directed RNA polymerase specialized sigma24 family protein|nr:sigma factor [Mucilaginibacter sp.]